MDTPRLASIAGALAVVATLAACGAGDAPDKGTPAAAAPKPAPARPAPVVQADRGQVSAIEPITTAAKPTGAGAVVGGVVGAAIGNQIGKGDGRTAATAVGAVGGAVVGNNVEKRRAEPVVVGYRVTVRMDNGSTRQFQPAQVGDLRVGDRVRVEGDTIRRV